MTDQAGRERTRAFFAARAAGWDEKFPDDEPKFADAVDGLALLPGELVLDVGCGTGRALPLLSEAVSPSGYAFGLDLTPEMCTVARTRAAIVVGDAASLPLPAGSCDAVLAAGLVHHLADPIAGLAELARVTRVGGRLALFHPIGRAALAVRHGHDLHPDDVRDPDNLPAALLAAQWRLTYFDDGNDRYLAVATRW